MKYGKLFHSDTRMSVGSDYMDGDSDPNVSDLDSPSQSPSTSNSDALMSHSAETLTADEMDTDQSDYDPVPLIRRQFLNAVIQNENDDDSDSPGSPVSQSPTTSQTHANFNVQPQSDSG